MATNEEDNRENDTNQIKQNSTLKLDGTQQAAVDAYASACCDLDF